MGQDDEDDAQMLQAKQQITFNVINKRKDQLRRWQSSEMNAEPARRTKRPKVQFQDSDIFLSACMSGDEEEVDELLAKGADINTCTVDGLTALHQSVIDSKPDMVRFLCEKGADVNAQDNEGWTPLHAAACCGNVVIVRYLCQHGADLSVVNSDKELALDLAVDEQCREYLENDYKRHMIDVEACREQELHMMLKDVKSWMSSGEYKDIPHHRTGGTAIHVAAGRGYTQLLELLIKAGGNVRALDKDGWTPLHAAAHWAERDACKMLIENGAELSDLTYTGLDVLGVADKECVDYLVELAADTAKLREKRKSPAATSISTSILQEKNHRTDEHVLLSTERKRDLQHRDQHSENEVMHETTTSTTIVIGPDVSTSSSNGVVMNDEEELEEEEEVEEEEEDVAEEVEEAEEEEEEEEDVEVVEKSVSRSLDGYSDRSSQETADTTSSRFASSSSTTSTTTPSSHRSTSVPTTTETPRSSMRFQESSSIGSGDQSVSATVPIVPLTAPPKAVHQSPSSWINRGFPLTSRSSSSSVTRSSSTPASEVISPPASLHSQQSLPSSSTSSVPSTPVVSNVMAATISSSAKNTPSPSGSVTISATFSKPSRWQSKTVTESEAERRNNSRMQRQHRRSTQGVTKEQLEEASRFATDEVARRSSVHTLQARLASEEKDLTSSSTNEEIRDGDVTTSATVSLANSPAANNVRRKSQGLSISRSNRRATGPVNPEDLVRQPPGSPALSLRLATGATSAPVYSPVAMRATTTTRFGDKAQSLPPTNGSVTMPSAQSVSSRSAIVAGLSPAPSSSMRTTMGITPLLPSTTTMTTSSRFLPSSSLSSSNGSSAAPYTTSSALQTRPTETNLNYKALFEKERAECERLRREMDELRRSQTTETWRGSSTTPAWRTRNASPSGQPHNLSVAKSTSLASFDENERRSMERKIADLELQLKTSQNLRMENQRLKEENGALVRVISKMTI